MHALSMATALTTFELNFSCADDTNVWSSADVLKKLLRLVSAGRVSAAMQVNLIARRPGGPLHQQTFRNIL